MMNLKARVPPPVPIMRALANTTKPMRAKIPPKSGAEAQTSTTDDHESYA
jgi:hypothetical protein